MAIVSEALAARYFPNQDPIGKRLAFNRPIRWQNGEEPVTAQVVGVVGNVKLDESFFGSEAYDLRAASAKSLVARGVVCGAHGERSGGAGPGAAH